MAAHKTAQFPGRLFTAERDGNIALCQVPIVSQNDPGTESKKFSKNKENRQRQRAGYRGSCAIKEINAKIEHAGSFSSAGQRGSVNLPAACFNQYNVGVLPSPFHCLGADFVRLISQKFESGRFLVMGADAGKLERQFAEIGREAVVSESSAELAAKLSQDAAATRFEIALWFYSSEKSDDDRMVEELSRCAGEIVLIPGAGVDVGERRPQIVAKFGQFRLLPDYECDLGEIHPGALRLRHRPGETADALVPGMETAFAKVNARLSGLQRALRDRVSELEAAHRHIASLEKKLLKLKQYKRELKSLKEQK